MTREVWCLQIQGWRVQIERGGGDRQRETERDYVYMYAYMLFRMHVCVHAGIYLIVSMHTLKSRYTYLVEQSMQVKGVRMLIFTDYFSHSPSVIPL